MHISFPTPHSRSVESGTILSKDDSNQDTPCRKHDMWNLCEYLIIITGSIKGKNMVEPGSAWLSEKKRSFIAQLIYLITTIASIYISSSRIMLIWLISLIVRTLHSPRDWVYLYQLVPHYLLLRRIFCVWCVSLSPRDPWLVGSLGHLPDYVMETQAPTLECTR